MNPFQKRPCRNHVKLTLSLFHFSHEVPNVFCQCDTVICQRLTKTRAAEEQLWIQNLTGSCCVGVTASKGSRLFGNKDVCYMTFFINMKFSNIEPTFQILHFGIVTIITPRNNFAHQAAMKVKRNFAKYGITYHCFDLIGMWETVFHFLVFTTVFFFQQILVWCSFQIEMLNT